MEPSFSKRSAVSPDKLRADYYVLSQGFFSLDAAVKHLDGLSGQLICAQVNVGDFRSLSLDQGRSVKPDHVARETFFAGRDLPPDGAHVVKSNDAVHACIPGSCNQGKCALHRRAKIPAFVGEKQ